MTNPMKPLLFALLFVLFYGCGVSMKEVRREIEMNNFDNFIDNMKKDDRIIDWIAKVEKKSDHKTFVRLWDEYVSDCRRVVYVGIGRGGKEHVTAVYSKYHTRKIVVSRTPTFDGFIEYLRNKK